MKLPRFLLFFLSASVILSSIFSFSACSDGKETGEIMTNVFISEEIVIPEDCTVINRISPYFNPDSGEISFVGESGNSLIRLTLSEDLTVFADVIVDDITAEDSVFPDGITYISNGALSADTLYSYASSRDPESEIRSYTAFSYNFVTGESKSADNIDQYFTHSDSNPRITGMSVDSEGYTYYQTDTEVLALNPNYAAPFTVFSYNYVKDTSVLCGTVYASGYWGARDCFVPIIPSEADRGDALNLPSSAENIIHGDTSIGYDIFFADSAGIYGKSYTDGTEVLLMDYSNSGVLADSVTPLYVYDSNRILMLEDGRLNLYTRSDDIDLSNIITIEVAYVDAPSGLLSNIAAFNRKNPGIRVIAKDYRDGGIDYDVAIEKLTIDIFTGVYKPDIVTSCEVNDVFIELYRHGLYTDLYPLIESTDYCTKDDLLGCFRRTFETPDGELWAFGEDLMILTLVAKTEIVGERDRWTLTDMLEFEKTLADDQYLHQFATQEGFSSYLLGNNGYSIFINEETNTCDFTGEDFMMFLDYAKSLPKTSEEMRMLTADLYPEDDPYYGFKTDNFILHEKLIASPSFWLSTGAAFGTDDITLIGYPSDGIYNGSMISLCPYVITSYCEHPDKAWEFIAQTILDEEINYQWCLPITRSKLTEHLEEMKKKYYDISATGNGIGGSLIEYADTNPVKPGYTRKFMTDEIKAEFLNFVDNIAGYPIEVSADDTINAIIEEELSAFLGGAQTKEECASVIQSRVSIYLSEHE